MSIKLIYDGDCAFCRGIIQLFLFFKLVDGDDPKPYASLTGDIKQKVFEAGIKNEIIAIDDVSLQTNAGVEALLLATKDRIPKILTRLVEYSFIRFILNFFYRLISFNRRIIAPLPGGFTCDCDPDFSLFYRSALINFLLAVLSLLAFVYASSKAMFVAATCFLILIGASFKLSKELRLDLIAHIAYVLFIGFIVIFPVLLVRAHAHTALLHWVGLAALITSLFIALRMIHRRVISLGLSQQWGMFSMGMISVIEMAAYFL